METVYDTGKQETVAGWDHEIWLADVLPAGPRAGTRILYRWRIHADKTYSGRSDAVLERWSGTKWEGVTIFVERGRIITMDIQEFINLAHDVVPFLT